MFAVHDENGVNNNFVWIPILRFVLLTHFFHIGHFTYHKAEDLTL